MRPEIIRRLLANLFVAIAAFGTAVQLYRFSLRKTRPPPVIAMLIIGSTALITGLQFIFPEVNLEKSPKQRGLNITFVTNAGNDDRARELFTRRRKSGPAQNISRNNCQRRQGSDGSLEKTATILAFHRGKT